MVNGIIIDYGGTLDTGGDHWATVIRSKMERLPISRVPVDTFCEAFISAERAAAEPGAVSADTSFADVLRLKARHQLNFLHSKGYVIGHTIPRLSEELAMACYSVAREHTARSLRFLTPIAEQLPLVLATNFYGNIRTVLDEFHLSHLFKDVVESATEGIRKPDPEFFRLALQRIGLPAEETLVVGDSLENDIKPARTIGCKTAWLKGKQWFLDKSDTRGEDYITSIVELLCHIKLF